jgi:hypothetical protein
LRETTAQSRFEETAANYSMLLLPLNSAAVTVTLPKLIAEYLKPKVHLHRKVLPVLY